MIRSLLFALSLLLAAPAFAGATIKLGTLAPDGSVWHRILQQMDADLRAATGGSVKLKIYAGGAMGDEGDMIRRMRLGQLQAAGVTGNGLMDIAPGMNVLQMPAMITQEGELDYVRDRLNPRFEKDLREKGFIPVAWVDGGWVHLFSNKPVAKPADLKKLKLWVWSREGTSAQIWKRHGMDPVNLTVADILPGLQTGMVDAFASTPLAVLSFQFFNHAKFMTAMRWGVVTGGVVLTAKAFDGLSAGEQKALMEAGKKATAKFVSAVDLESKKALEEMQKRGLTIVPVPPDAEKEWMVIVEDAWKAYRGTNIPVDIFDETMRLRNEFRAKKK